MYEDVFKEDMSQYEYLLNNPITPYYNENLHLIYKQNNNIIN